MTPDDPPRTVLVIPCYNEADRLRTEAVRSLTESWYVETVLVNDGSTDNTGEVLAQLASDLGRVTVHAMRSHRGKAEAVRQGLLAAIDYLPDWVGYCDADMSTPVCEVLRLNEIATTSPGLSVVLASRISLFGLNVQHSALRHYRDRAFATVATKILGVPVYDTRCGAKFFRNTDALRDALSEPFHSRWSFDVELLGRLLRGRAEVAPVPVAEFVEVPLNEWHDVDGSRLRTTSSIKAGLELALIAGHLRRW